ncbi:MAG TPA: ABC transporter ATP-binding protein [Mycobacteriales bacterium]|nr:ABC transporter ATP-binding protein [Mycobacteriales bacterium]
MTPRLALSGLTHRYRHAETPALSDLDLEVGAGEIVCVVGPSGAGKTTLLRLVAGLLAPTSGSVVIDGVDVTRHAPERRAVAMVFQGYALFPHLTVAENIRFGLRVRREPRQAERVRDVAAELGLEDLLSRRPSELSGGERQRVALARALVRAPAVFCLDEPLASLDPALRGAAGRLLSTVLRAHGRGALVVTHDQAEAMTLGDRVAVVRDGRLEQVGRPVDIYARPATPFVAGFVGMPPANVLTATSALADGLDVPPGGHVAVRAEDVRLGPTGLPAVVATVAHLGAIAHVLLDVTGTPLVAVVPAAKAPEHDAAVRVTIDPAKALRYDADGRLR